MEWFLIFVSVAVVWLASLCKILHSSFYPDQSSFLNNNAGSIQKKNVLLVIAHPDDESMFFSPTINQLTSRGHNLHILCMSTGNADGIGDVRKEELYKASAILKVPLKQVTALDLPDFQDGFGKVWNSSKLSKIVEEKILAHAIDMIITFDNYGVSGHCNHRDVHHGVKRFMLDTSKQEIEAWELVSTNIVRKYSGPVDIWLSFWSAHNSPNGEMHCVLNEHPLRSYAAMSQHLSQWVDVKMNYDQLKYERFKLSSLYRQYLAALTSHLAMAKKASASAPAETAHNRKMASRPKSTMAVKQNSAAKRPKMTAAKKKASKLDAMKPKKPPTAFFYFLEDFRKEFQEQNPDVKSMREVGKACGEKWKIMTYEEKVQYYDIATEKRAEFEKAMAYYLQKKESGEYDEFDEDSDFDE